MNIYQKLIEVRKGVVSLSKDSEGYKFKYTSSSQVLKSLRSAMDEQGLLLIPRVTEHVMHPKGGDRSEHLTELAMEFTWINAENPEEKVVCPWYGQGLDTGERGVGKALTYSEKYFLLKFFNIATDEDDPDAFQDKPEWAENDDSDDDDKKGLGDVVITFGKYANKTIAEIEKIDRSYLGWLGENAKIAEIRKAAKEYLRKTKEGE